MHHPWEMPAGGQPMANLRAPARVPCSGRKPSRHLPPIGHTDCTQARAPAHCTDLPLPTGRTCERTTFLRGQQYRQARPGGFCSPFVQSITLERKRCVTMAICVCECCANITQKSRAHAHEQKVALHNSASNSGTTSSGRTERHVGSPHTWHSSSMSIGLRLRSSTGGHASMSILRSDRKKCVFGGCPFFYFLLALLSQLQIHVGRWSQLGHVCRFVVANG